MRIYQSVSLALTFCSLAQFPLAGGVVVVALAPDAFISGFLIACSAGAAIVLTVVLILSRNRLYNGLMEPWAM